jgi:hypothetical protein
MRAMIENARGFYTVEPAVSNRRKRRKRKQENEEECGTSPGVNREGKKSSTGKRDWGKSK